MPWWLRDALAAFLVASPLAILATMVALLLALTLHSPRRERR